MLSKHFVEGSSAVVEIPDIKYSIFEVSLSLFVCLFACLFVCLSLYISVNQKSNTLIPRL